MSIGKVNVAATNQYTQVTNSQTNKAKSKNSVQKENRDTFVRGKNTEEASAVPSQKRPRLTPNEMKDLAKRYDVENLSTQEMKDLLTELEDKGILDKNEAFKIRCGAVPMPDDIDTNFGKYARVVEDGYDPYGLENLSDADWLGNFGKLTDYLKFMQKSEDSEQMKDTYQTYVNMYTKITDIFQQIANTRNSMEND